MVSHKEILETREKFYALARKAFPNTAEPGTVWVLSEVLEWEWNKITQVCVEGFSKEGYRVFAFDPHGKKIISDDGISVKAITRKWTSEEKRKLRDWWWLLGF